MEQQTLRRADRVVAVSAYTAEAIKEVYEINKLDVIPNGIDCTVFSPEASLCSYPAAQTFRVLYLGRTSRRKGADLIAPIGQMLGQGYEIVIVGERKAWANAGLPGTVTFVRPPDDEGAMSRLYRSCHVLLFPSRLEGFGLAALEAQACGLPVVASDVSAIPEVVTHNVTGLLCPPADIPAFATAIRMLRVDKTAWTRMSNAATEMAVKLFGGDKLLSSYGRAYNDLLSGASLEECT